MLIVVSLLWGIASPIIKFSLPHFPPVLFLTYRFLISAIIMIPVLLYLEPKSLHVLGHLSASSWFWLVVSGILGSTVQLTLLFWGLDLTTSVDGAVINAISPIFVAAAGFIFLKEHLTRNENIGLALATLGTGVIIFQPLLAGHTLFSGSFLGNLLVLLGTFAWVGYVILTKKQLNHRITPLFLTTNMFVVGFFVESILLFYTTTQQEFLKTIVNAPFSAHLSVLYMAIFSGAIAYYLYQKAQKIIEVSEANIILHLSPIFSIPLAHFWLGEPITIPFVIGSIIITVGVVFSELDRQRRKHVR
ncbi:MAG: DMT family transporter [Patescibacteria group bacterium]